MADWKNSCNLPTTAFPMKAGLQTAEPEAIARWEAMDLYGQIAAARAGRPKFVLHDGPPYANGRVHIGHALNKVLKDFIVKSKSMAGYDAPYVPGWDCHGLPIELQVDKELGSKKREMSQADFRRACRAYAERFVALQCEDFKRLSVFGTWDQPYLTMRFEYQAAIVRALGRFVEQDLVYKGKKPVHWCIHCRTALAEAEVEYEDHTSPSIYVEFPIASDETALFERVPALRGRDVTVLIWTTTPWTIPSNLGIAFHPEYEYGAYEVDGRVVVLAEDLAASAFARAGRELPAPLVRIKGETFDRVRFTHPLYPRDSLGVLADYVTLEQGTGAVHTAPGHGSDDFATGQKYGLDTYAPVGPGGHFLDSVEQFAGLRVFDANPRIVEALKAAGRLWHHEPYAHSYPHCWRCHHPVIFLATPQWFIAMDRAQFRERSLAEVARVEWLPTWGEERIHNMLANRPDWCISRQRAWGVPIPAMSCVDCREAVLTKALTERAAAVFVEHGADAWYERPLEEFLPEDGLTCAACGGHEFERERDILDVWFDSGCSHEAVLEPRPELTWPADVYLEGSDQYRGWFHSSLLVAVGTRGRAPYRQVITHGFVVDEDGRKMSKSKGNGVEPQDVIAQSGAEVLRLWAAMVDYTEEVRLGKQVLARTIEAYRKIRNTLRYLLANLFDFDPATDLVAPDEMLDVDRYAMARYAESAARMRAAYEAFDFQVIFHELNRLVTVDLSAFYFDVSKDRLYTFGTASRDRRSAQTAMYLMADGLTRLIAPILPVTADALWRELPGTREHSVHIALFPDAVASWEDVDRLARWRQLLDVRDQVNARLEDQRQAKVIGNALEARVELHATGPYAPLLEAHADQLATLFIVSDVVVLGSPQVAAASGVLAIARAITGQAPVADDEGTLAITVTRAEGVKCQRCWRYVPDVSDAPASEGLCARCVDALGLEGTAA